MRCDGWSVPGPIEVPPLTDRMSELSRIVDEYVFDAIVELAPPPRSLALTERDRQWLIEHSAALWEGPDGYERIDVENPNPGKRPGQIHYQPDKAHKWYYDPVKNEFYDQKTGKPAPKSVNDKLADPEIGRAVDEGMRQLNGENKK